MIKKLELKGHQKWSPILSLSEKSDLQSSFVQRFPYLILLLLFAIRKFTQLLLLPVLQLIHVNDLPFFKPVHKPDPEQ